MGRRKKTADDGLDSYLRGGSPLSKAYRALPDAEPPAERDQAVLAAARKPATRRARFAFSPFATNWAVPASLAAVLMLTVGLTMFMVERADIPAPGEIHGEDTLRPAPRANPALGRDLDLPKTPEPPDAAASRPTAAESLERPRQPGVERREVQDASPAKLKSALEEAPAAAAPSPAAAPEWEVQRDRGTAAQDDDWRASPEAWLAHIDRLRRAGREAEARASLEEFRRAHPQHPASRVPPR